MPPFNCQNNNLWIVTQGTVVVAWEVSKKMILHVMPWVCVHCKTVLAWDGMVVVTLTTKKLLSCPNKNVNVVDQISISLDVSCMVSMSTKFPMHIAFLDLCACR